MKISLQIIISILISLGRQNLRCPVKFDYFWNRRHSIFDNEWKIRRRFGHICVSNLSFRTKDNNNPDGEFSLRVCELSQSRCVLWCCHRLFVWLFIRFYDLWLTYSSLDNGLIYPPKHITSHLNSHLISDSLVTVTVSIRSKKQVSHV